MTSMIREASTRTPSQREQILKALIDAGDSGVTNVELARIGNCYSARLRELYSQGLVVTVRSMGDGVYNYTLVELPTSGVTMKSKIDVVIRKINRTPSGKVTVEQLKEILAENEVTVARKSRPRSA